MVVQKIQKVVAIQKMMQGKGMGTVLVTPSSSLFFTIGRKLPQTERFNAILIPVRGRAAIVVPVLQRPLVADLEDEFDILVWDEAQDPIQLAAEFIANQQDKTVAVDGQMSAGFLLSLQNLSQDVSYFNATSLIAPLRTCKSPSELALLDDLGVRFDRIWQDFVENTSMVGMTEYEIFRRIAAIASDHGFTELAWCDVGSGPNGASPLHHWSQRKVEPGDPVVIDFAAISEGYYMDTCRTPVAHEAHEQFVEIYDIVNRAYEAAFDLVRPGVAAENIDAAARQVISTAGYGEYFIHRLGHGLGIDGHEAPYIVDGNKQLLEEGMTFSIEPGIYIPNRWGVRTENIVTVTENGARSFNQFSRELVEMQ